MEIFQPFRSLRNRLILSLFIIVLIIFGFGFYTFLKVTEIGASIQAGTLSETAVLALRQDIELLSRVSFGFLAATLVFVFGLLINLIFTLTFSLKSILAGISELEKGNLNYQIPLKSADEFGEIAKFLNLAAVSLGKAQKELEEEKRGVEKKVEERTKQLKELTEKLELDKILVSAERNKLALALSGIQDAVITVDLQGLTIIFNKGAENLTGFSQEEVLGKPTGQVFEIYDDGKKLAPSEFCPINPKGREGVVFEKQNLRLVGKNNKQMFVNLIAGQIKEGLSANVGCILTLHDVTEEKELEQMKLDFVSMAAHELRTPLTSIKGYLSVLIAEGKNKFDAEQNMFLSRIYISAQQLAALIENLLSVSKIERGAFAVSLSPVDLAGVIIQKVVEFVDRAKEKKIELKFSEPKTPIPQVKADKLRFAEVLDNLLSNAINFTKAGGKINVWVEKNAKEVVTHVQDTGIGIPKDAISHLFTKFFRVSGPLEEGAKGTGLGLYISKKIVEMHHGKIWVESELGKGSEFCFSLPFEKNG